MRNGVLIFTLLCCAAVAVGYRVGWRSGLGETTFEHTNPPLEANASMTQSTVHTGTVVEEKRVRFVSTSRESRRAARESRVISPEESRIAALKELEALSTEELLARLRSEAATDGERSQLQNLLSVLALRDPKRALAIIDESFPERERVELRERVHFHWAESDPAAAWQAIRSIHKAGQAASHSSDLLYQRVFELWARKDLNAALAAWNGLPEVLQKSTLGGIGAAARLPESRARLLEFVQALPAGEVRASAFGGVLQNWVGSTSLEEVAQWLDTKDFSPTERAELERKAAASAMEDRPRAVADWLLARSNPERRAEDLEALVRAWAGQQPSAAGAWLASVPLGPDTDKAVVAFANDIKTLAPDTAFAWARCITDEKLRKGMLTEVFGNWHSESPSAANEFVESGNLTDEEKRWLRPWLKR